MEEIHASTFGKAPFKLEWRDLPVPDLQPGKILVRVEAGGICGTDIHFLRYNEEWTPLGHEAVGIVEKASDGVEGVQVGDRVIIENHAACWRCKQCKNGRPQYCEI